MSANDKPVIASLSGATLANILLDYHILLLSHSPKSSLSLQNIKLVKYFSYCTRHCVITSTYPYSKKTQQ